MAWRGNGKKGLGGRRRARTAGGRRGLATLPDPPGTDDRRAFSRPRRHALFGRGERRGGSHRIVPESVTGDGPDSSSPERRHDEGPRRRETVATMNTVRRALDELEARPDPASDAGQDRRGQRQGDRSADECAWRRASSTGRGFRARTTGAPSWRGVTAPRSWARAGRAARGESGRRATPPSTSAWTRRHERQLLVGNGRDGQSRRREGARRGWRAETMRREPPPPTPGSPGETRLTPGGWARPAHASRASSRDRSRRVLAQRGPSRGAEGNGIGKSVGYPLVPGGATTAGINRLDERYRVGRQAGTR